jgi:rhomboid family GlyGly-CTERM serine protease
MPATRSKPDLPFVVRGVAAAIQLTAPDQWASFFVRHKLVLGILAISLLSQFFSQHLIFERSQILSGELWRLLSGHFVHVGFVHMLFNMAGLILTFHIFKPYFSDLEWVLITVSSSLLISAGFLLFLTTLHWYAGFSGVLHGLLAAGALVGISERSPLSAMILSILIAKIGFESILGPMQISEGIIRARIIVEAHLAGAASGSVTALCLIALRRKTRQ